MKTSVAMRFFFAGFVFKLQYAGYILHTFQFLGLCKHQCTLLSVQILWSTVLIYCVQFSFSLQSAYGVYCAVHIYD